MSIPDSPRLDLAIKQLEFARSYTLELLRDIEDNEWFSQAHGGISHIAWQVGHLAMAEYGLTMLRIRGKEPEDEQYITADFFRRFKKGTSPDPNPEKYPSPAEIREVLARIHERALFELSGYTDRQLDIKLPEPYAVFDTKLGSILFCSAHELIHAGQIGLLRRTLGKSPLR